MKVTGIIAEFNPFHNGHKYLIEQAKLATGSDRIVIVMSGSFTQRGTPAYMNKYDRANYALMEGADLVLELPVSYSSATAEVFAYGGVSILNSLGIVDNLVFGSESGDITPLSHVADEIMSPSTEKQLLISKALAKGLSYPAARAHAYPEYRELLNNPNNILAIEYIKSLKKLNSQIVPYSIKRKGANYHDTDIGSMASAEGIRSYISKNGLTDEVQDSVSSPIFESMKCNYLKSWPIDINDFSSLIYYSLLNSSMDLLGSFQDMNPDIANRIINKLNSFECASDFISLNKTKELTYSRISRALLHCMLQLADLTRDEYGTLLACPYTRILGFKKDNGELMHEIAKSCTIPVVTKAADASKIIAENAYPMFEATIKADRIYDQIVSQKYNYKVKDTLATSPLIL